MSGITRIERPLVVNPRTPIRLSSLRMRLRPRRKGDLSAGSLFILASRVFASLWLAPVADNGGLAAFALLYAAKRWHEDP